MFAALKPGGTLVVVDHSAAKGSGTTLSDSLHRIDKDAVVATMQSTGTWDGVPRPGRYKLVPAPMNGEPAALAYVRASDGRYHAVCLTVISLDADGRVVELTTFVLPELFAAWGFPPVLDA